MSETNLRCPKCGYRPQFKGAACLCAKQDNNAVNSIEKLRPTMEEARRQVKALIGAERYKTDIGAWIEVINRHAGWFKLDVIDAAIDLYDRESGLHNDLGLQTIFSAVLEILEGEQQLTQYLRP